MQRQCGSKHMRGRPLALRRQGVHHHFLRGDGRMSRRGSQPPKLRLHARWVSARKNTQSKRRKCKGLRLKEFCKMEDKLYRVHSATKITLSPEAREICKLHGVSERDMAKHLLAQHRAEGGEIYDYDETYNSYD